ncbi:MAG: hypothetical protein HC818_01505 [Synechococcaceae cyanobacterium RM1_1_27]|nr:hypothetical protein [Synechococcaceae cyanobacterium RM1_1_27]
MIQRCLASPRFRFPRRFRFTRIGRFFTGMTILVSVAAFNTGNNPLYLLFGMMLSLIIISGVLSEQVLQKVVVSRDIPPRFFAGQEGIVMLRVKNTKKRAPSFSLRISDRIRGIPRDQHPSIYLLRVDAGQEASAFYRHTFPRRGVWQLEGVEVATSFPFELFRKGLDIVLEQEVVVFPRPAPPPPLPLLASLPQGSQPRPYRGSEGDFLPSKSIGLGMIYDRCIGKPPPSATNCSPASWSAKKLNAMPSASRISGSRWG